jgi:hypothetical protein
MATETRNLLIFQAYLVTQVHFFTFCLLLYYTLTHSLLVAQIPQCVNIKQEMCEVRVTPALEWRGHF